MDVSKPGLLIIDKDWTLVKPRGEATFSSSPWDQVPINDDLTLAGDMVIAVEYLSLVGFEVVVASNQGGVEAGHKTLEETFLEMRYLLELFPGISTVLFCPDFAGRECWQCWGNCKDEYRILYTTENPFVNPEIKSFRKPEAGMLQLAIDLRQQDSNAPVVYVGDRPEDQQAAQRAGIEFCWAQEFPQKVMEARNAAVNG